MKLSALPVWVTALLGVTFGIALRLLVDGGDGFATNPHDASGVSVRAEASLKQTQPRPYSLPADVFEWTDQLSVSQLEKEVG